MFHHQLRLLQFQLLLPQLLARSLKQPSDHFLHQTHGFDAENDQMVVSVNAPRAEEEEVEIVADGADGETSSEGDAGASDDSEGSDESDENS
jgi:hypothetical protein